MTSMADDVGKVIRDFDPSGRNCCSCALGISEISNFFLENRQNFKAVRRHVILALFRPQVCSFLFPIKTVIFQVKSYCYISSRHYSCPRWCSMSASRFATTSAIRQKATECQLNKGPTIAPHSSEAPNYPTRAKTFHLTLQLG